MTLDKKNLSELYIGNDFFDKYILSDTQLVFGKKKVVVMMLDDGDRAFAMCPLGKGFLLAYS